MPGGLRIRPESPPHPLKSERTKFQYFTISLIASSRIRNPAGFEAPSDAGSRIRLWAVKRIVIY